MAAESGRIPEKEIIEAAIKALAAHPRDFVSTTDLIAELTEIMTPTGEDLEIIEGRQDTKFSQKVRNLVSHRSSPNGLEARGLAIYDKELEGWCVTEEGRRYGA